jgi:hypothetical protein
VVHATLEVQILSAILDESTRRDDWDPHSPTESISSA